MAVPKGKKKSGSAQEKTYSFTFTVPEIIGLCAGGVAALCAFFILGILLGRGYQPEKDMPELAMMMPSQSTNKSGEVKGGVLKPEDLQYIDQLKIKPESAVAPQPKKPKATPPVKKKPAPAKKIQAPVEKTQPATQTVKAQKAPSDTEPEVEIEIDNPDEPDTPVYHYIYQAASFGSEIRAQEFSSKLVANGLDSYVQSGKGGSRTWYRVFVRHTGTPDSTSIMRKVLTKFGIKKPLLKSKKSAE
ncbi:SPOR domain-containing protein [Maridesulfovibrio hydrothermalis]|uniref:Sporulation domain protein n=1 Tax=Maridesulfovibrio hydrothermalis AM13 = DSM 14728 TaxID=1121451 RepID=L0R8Q8_9BACT|nr:SPOR domain-containing protein [Maridesulfovibrio hydrothermalis]CCO23144.1 Sporulation domain protein [Maridesulfovibrio hydrothermalis AM13 = DSM 14728]